MGQYEVEARYGGAIEHALKAIGSPGDFVDCVAVQFDAGGDDGYWMRLLGNENFDDRRVGSLMVGENGKVCYAEMCAFKTRPKSNVRKVAMMAGGGKNLLGFYSWTASPGQLSDLSVFPICPSPHGAYAAVEFTVSGRRRRIGVDAGRPDAHAVVSALRHFADADHDFERSSGPPRHDGLYLFGTRNRKNQFHGLIFDEGRAAFLAINDPAVSYAQLRSGEWQINWSDTFTRDGELYIDHAETDYVRHVVVQPDGRLITQTALAAQRAPTSHFGNAAWEFEFVPDTTLTGRWGEPSISGPLPGPDWPPVLGSDGQLLAADLGHQRARAKG